MAKGAVIGYGISGRGAERILREQGISEIDIYDDRKEGCLPVADFTDKYDVTVISPGIALNRLPVMPAKYTSELELASKWMPDGARIVGVTGTNGKSTVTSLTAQILNNAGVTAVACGNIGYSFADAVLDHDAKVYVVELSSFQIELLRDFDVSAAAIINMTPDHLDRYASLDEYYAAKLRLADFVEPEGVMIADSDTTIVNKLLKARYKVHYIDRELKSWPRLQSGIMHFDTFAVNIAEYKLFGRHNLVNLAFALALASAAAKFEGDVTYALNGLKGMPHRTERFSDCEGVSWIDDSKATNVDSTLIALKSSEYPCILLLGGRDKKGDFTILAQDINRACSLVITFGEAGDTIRRQLEEVVKINIKSADSLKNAVALAYAEAAEGAAVLLSPGCASYDEFNNFEERGAAFKKYVKELCGIK